MYNNPINNTDPTGHKACDEQWGCEGQPNPPQPRPPKGPTNTNTPGGSNRPAGHATRAEHTGGNDRGSGSPEALRRPDIFIGNPQDVAEAWNLLDKAKGYGPRTRALIEGYEEQLLLLELSGYPSRITIVRNSSDIGEADYNTSIIDIGDVEKFPSYGPVPPENVILHEFVEQSVKQIWGLKPIRGTDQHDYDIAHGRAIFAENQANTERFGFPVTRGADEAIIGGVRMTYIFIAPGICGIAHVSASVFINPFTVSVSGAPIP